MVRGPCDNRLDGVATAKAGRTLTRIRPFRWMQPSCHLRPGRCYWPCPTILRPIARVSERNWRAECTPCRSGGNS